jgi:hypothetical protein
MEFNEKIFIDPKIKIDPSADVIFVADFFSDEVIGGAELTTDAIIDESPLKVQRLRSSEVDLACLSQGVEKFWIFGNFSMLKANLIPTIISNLRYSIVEYDYKYCTMRSPEKHALSQGQCNCASQTTGHIVSSFFAGASFIWWMSEKQKNHYLQKFPSLASKDSLVLSSVFSKSTLEKIRQLSLPPNDPSRSVWVYLESNSWVKGTSLAKEYIEKHGLKARSIAGMSYDQTLQLLSKSRGLVYLPAGGDTCPRLVIEAKLLGCELVLNDNVQHKDEDWFTDPNIENIFEYLLAAPGYFWKVMSTVIARRRTISGYTTTYNCIKQNYPFVQSIESMLGFCDEICVVDGGSTDGTYETLLKLAAETAVQDPKTGEPVLKIRVKQVKRDWDDPRFAVFDGMQKAEARSMCTSEFCWQMDSDEVVHEDDYDMIRNLCEKIPNDVDVLCLPVIEYWGGPDKVRADIQPWKWRLSRNKENITHGIPMSLRKTDSSGRLCAHPGTDGCDMIYADSGNPCMHVTFHTPQMESARLHAIAGNRQALEVYQRWFNEVVNHIPGVHHYSWYDMKRKMKTYRDYWTRHWNSLYDTDMRDTADTNMMFDLPWSEVTDDMIEQRANEIVSKTGGWVWHKKWNGTCVPHLRVDREQPAVMSTWRT